jgi:hypothetical protein
VFTVRYEVGFYIPEDDILHSHCGEKVTLYDNIVIYFKQNRKQLTVLTYARTLLAQ